MTSYLAYKPGQQLIYSKQPTTPNNLDTFELFSTVIVSVDYRKAPEYPVPTCFHDAWEAIKWTMQHENRKGPDTWLNEYPDYGNIFLANDSAGASIAHHMAIRAGSDNPGRVINLKGIVLLHPYFWGKDRIRLEDEHPFKAGPGDVWMIAHPGTSGFDDPLIKPDKDPKVSDLECSKLLVCVAENDLLKDRGWYYKEILDRNGWKGSIEVIEDKNGWKGSIEVIEDKNEGNVFFVFNPTSESAGILRKRIGTFINHADN